MHGKSPNLTKLYGFPSTPPTSRQPMLSNFVHWNHKEQWHVPKYRESIPGTVQGSGYQVTVDISSEKDAYLKDHAIDGRVIYPAAGFLVMVWEALASRKGKGKEDCDVTIQGFKVHEASIVKEDGKLLS